MTERPTWGEWLRQDVRVPRWWLLWMVLIAAHVATPHSWFAVLGAIELAQLALVAWWLVNAVRRVRKVHRERAK